MVNHTESESAHDEIECGAISYMKTAEPMMEIAEIARIGTDVSVMSKDGVTLYQGSLKDDEQAIMLYTFLCKIDSQYSALLRQFKEQVTP